MRKAIFICLFWLCAICVSAQESRYSTDTLAIYFPVNDYRYDPSYLGNNQVMEKLQSLQNIRSIRLRVTSSPEGNTARNQWLSQQRSRSLVDYFNSNNISILKGVEIEAVDEAWRELYQMVSNSDMPWRDDVLKIIEDPKTRKAQMTKYRNGTVWRWLIDNWFPALRSFTVIAEIEREIPVIAAVSFSTPQVRVPAPIAAQLHVDEQRQFCTQQKPWISNLTVKTNAIALGMGLINVAAEYDIAPHWSVALPFYYSGGYDYFKPTLKFRGIVLQPELRYYLRDNDGFYAGVHFGLGWYNFALNDEFRVQDHKGARPAVGGV